jgi:hypothetical protein
MTFNYFSLLSEKINLKLSYTFTNSTVFCDKVSCSLVVCTDNFGRICCLRHMNRSLSSTPMEAAVGTHYRTTRCHVPQDCCLHTHCRENHIHHNKKSIFTFSIHMLQKIFSVIFYIKAVEMLGCIHQPTCARFHTRCPVNTRR